MTKPCALLALAGIVAMTPTFAATQCVRPGGGGGCFSSIQGAINGSAPGDTVLIHHGTYIENITVNKSLILAGEDTEDVVIRPAVSAPNPSGCSGASLCAGASNVILVQASGVTIHDLTVDGNNPHLHSGISAGGVDLDARNGIITDHHTGVYNNLEVHHVVVRNTYLRGMYASSGGTFNFHDNSVSNVQADPSSICMFNFGGAGVMARNHASDCNDALSSNWSGGVQFLNNEVEHSGSGVHTDNSGGFGTLSTDLISGNKVSNGMAGAYGIFVFVPYVQVRVENNLISGQSVGLAAFGSAAPVTTMFSNNSVDGRKIAASVGAFVTTDQLGFGANPVSAAFNNNLFTANVDGFQVQATAAQTSKVTGTCNAMLRNSHSGILSNLGPGGGINNISLTSGNIARNGIGAKNDTIVPINAQSNWWGCAAGPNAPGCDTTSGPVNFVPALAQPAKCASQSQGEGGDDNNDREN